MQRGAFVNCAVWPGKNAGFRRRSLAGLALAIVAFASAGSAYAQEPPQRQIRAFIPPDQIVSFLPTTPFPTFLDNLNPIFVQVTGKRVIDPENRNFQIQVSVVGMQFFDAFELVLDAHRLTYRETDRYFLIENAPEESMMVGEEGAARGPARGELEGATARSREIEIEAVLFEINHSKNLQTGIDWSVFVGEQSQQSGGSQQDFFIETDDFFDKFDSWLIAPDQINVRQINSFFRLTEQAGLGTTVASPKISVRSGEQGRIQIGSDIPIQVRDFAGNTITQFVQTGIIIQVTPTLVSSPLADTAGSPVLDFIHLDVRVERSQSRPSFGGIAIDRSTAETDVLLLDNEMTVIGGLYQTDETIDRAGIPVLKDLPWWVFGLRYIFGKQATITTRRELLMVLRARLIDGLPQRAEQPFAGDHHKRSREQVLDILRRFDPRMPAEWPTELLPETLDKEAKVAPAENQ